MSIIQEALKKAEVKVGTPVLIKTSDPTTRKVEEIAFTRKVITKITPRKPAFAKRTALILIAAAFLFSAIYCAIWSIHTVVNNLNKNTSAVNQEVSYRSIQSTDAGNLLTGPKDALIQGKILTIAENPRLELNGIMYREEGSRAIVNNSIVEEGDSISGARVTKINEKNVVLIYNNVEITISLK